MRPIIVAFKDYTLTETIIKTSNSLKGSGFRVERDYPSEIVEARQRFWPILKAERTRDPTGRVTIAYQAKLVKNRRVIHDEFPDWFEVLRVSRAGGFECDADESDDETDIQTGSQVRANRRPFRPWKAGNTPDAHGAPHEVMEGSESDSSGVQQSESFSQGARRKVFTKTKQHSNRMQQKKMTEIVPEKMKSSKDRTRRNKINFIAPNNSYQKSGNPPKRLNVKAKSQTPPSSLPDPTR